MPNLIDFFSENSNNDEGIQKMSGQKPCSKCELDVSEYFWDEIKLIMKWTCENGHETIHKVG